MRKEWRKLHIEELLSLYSSCSYIACIILKKTVPWLRRLVAGLSPRRSVFNPKPVYVVFVFGKVTIGQEFLRVLHFSAVSITPSCSVLTYNLSTTDSVR